MCFENCILGLLFLFSFVNATGQDDTKLDSIVQAFEVNMNPVELINHPIQKHFLYSQNKVEINQSSRELAATFDDPSRVLYRHAGISIANDQNNSIVYRGLPSEFVKWSINGAEIVNPNHLNNAGRFSDQSSPSAGGVLAIPFEVVNKFSFYGNAYNPEQVSSLSGVSDFNFDSNGNNFIKIGLLGMEAGFQTKGKVKVKGDLRYSTVGLLSDFGVNFEGESIKFYDGFVKADISNKFSIIGIAGNSTNFHEAMTNIENVDELKDLKEIDFKSNFFIAGITYKDENYSHSFFASKRMTSRTSEIDENLFQSTEVLTNENFSRDIEKYAYNGYRKLKLFENNLGVGLRLTTVTSSQMINDFSINEKIIYFSPYVNYKYLISTGDVNFKLEPGVSLIGNDTYKINPSLFTQTSYKNFLLDINYALKHVPKEFSEFNGLDKLDKVESYSIALKYQLPKRMFSTSAKLFAVNVNTSNYFLQAALNGVVDPGLVSLIPLNNSKVNSNGIEVMIDKSWNKGWYTNVNATFFDARYSDFGNFDFNTNENFKSIFNFVITKEIRTRQNNRWVINLAFHQRGGAFQNEFDFIENTFDERRLSTYYRIDARFQCNWNTKNILTLDIQNLTNNLNDAYYFFDAFLNEEVLEKQLGTIPILSYKRVL